MMWVWLRVESPVLPGPSKRKRETEGEGLVSWAVVIPRMWVENKDKIGVVGTWTGHRGIGREGKRCKGELVWQKGLGKDDGKV